MTAPQLAVAALVRRPDGRVLAVQAAQGPHAGRWSLPLRAVALHEVAEDAVTALLRDLLHLQPGPIAFADTFTLTGGAVEVIANVFECTGWRGQPQYRALDFTDAIWVDPAAPSAADLAPEVLALLSTLHGGGEGGAPPPSRDPVALLAALEEARAALLGAADEAAEDAAAEVLANAAGFEAYVTGETRRLLHIPGHTWRPFNPDQATAERRVRPRSSAEDARAALSAARMETSLWVRSLKADQLSAFGNHADRGAVRLGDLLLEIVNHDRAAMARLTPAPRSPAPRSPAPRSPATALRSPAEETKGDSDAAAAR